MTKGLTSICSRGSRTYVLLVSIVALAAILRIVHLTSPGLWTDEFTVAQEMVSMPYFAVWDDPQKTYVDTLFRQPLVKYFRTDLALRIPSIVYGLLSVLVMGLLSFRLFPNLKYLGALFVAVNPSHIRYSQEGRYYITIYLLTCLVIYGLFRIKSHCSKGSLIGLALVMALLSLTQRTCLIVPWVLCCSFMLFYWAAFSAKERLHAALAFVASQILSAPAYYNAWMLRKSVVEGAFAHPTAAERLQQITPSRYFEVIAQSVSTEFGMLGEAPTGHEWWVVVLFFAGIAWLAFKNWQLLGFLLLSAGTLVTVMFVLMLNTMLPHERYVYFAVPALHLILIAGTVGIAQTACAMFRASKVGAVCKPLVGVLVLMGTVFPGLEDYYKEMKYSYKQSAQLLSLASGSGGYYFLDPPFKSWHLRQINWYLNYPGLAKGEKLQIQDVRTTDTALAQMEAAMEAAEGDETLIGFCSGMRSSAQDATLVTMLREMGKIAKAVEVQQHDGQTAFLVNSRIYSIESLQDRWVQQREWVSSLEKRWGGDSQTKANLIATEMQIMAKLPGVNPEVVRDGLRRIIKYSKNDIQRAQAHIELGDLARAQQLLLKAKRERPNYFYPYILLADLYEKQFVATLDKAHLIDSLEVLYEMRNNSVPSQGWFLHRELALAELLQECYLVEALLRNEDTKLSVTMEMLAERYKLTGKKRLQHHLPSALRRL